MENIKTVLEDTITNNTAPKEKDFQPQSQEFNVFMMLSVKLKAPPSGILF